MVGPVNSRFPVNPYPQPGYTDSGKATNAKALTPTQVADNLETASKRAAPSRQDFTGPGPLPPAGGVDDATVQDLRQYLLDHPGAEGPIRDAINARGTDEQKNYANVAVTQALNMNKMDAGRTDINANVRDALDIQNRQQGRLALQGLAASEGSGIDLP